LAVGLPVRNPGAGVFRAYALPVEK